MVSTVDEIEWAVKRLRNHRSGTPSWMRAEQIKGLLVAAKRKEREEAAVKKEHLKEDRTTEGPNGTGREETLDIRGWGPTEVSNWERVVELVQTEFREGQLAEEAMWQAVVLITKGEKDYHGIGLVEVMWKVVADILNL